MFRKIIAEKRRNKDGTWPTKWTICSVEKMSDKDYKERIEGKQYIPIETSNYKRHIYVEYYYA